MEKYTVKIIFNYITAILKKDLILLTKYKLQLFISYISVLVYLFTIHNFSKALSLAGVNESGLFLSNPFLFLITGYMVIDLTVTILNIITSQINFYQTSGMFEEMMLIENQKLFYLSSFIFVFILWFLRNFFYVFISLYFYDLNLTISLNILNILIFIVCFFSIILFLFGISFLAASFTIIFKKGNPIIILGTLLTTIFSGAIYPVSVLTPALQPVSNLIPTTYFLDQVRIFMIGLDLELNFSFFYLLVSSMLFFVVGLISFFNSILYSKKTGKVYTY